MDFRMSANTVCFEGDEHMHVKAIKFDTGETLPADLVVMAAGIRPNTTLAQSVGIYCERGIVVNDTLQTYDPSIYAVGECVQHRGELFGLVAPIWDQAKVCANHLANYGIGIYKNKEVSTKLKVTGVDLFSAETSWVKMTAKASFSDPKRVSTKGRGQRRQDSGRRTLWRHG